MVAIQRLGRDRRNLRDVAQLGSAPDWGSGGRGFKSRLPDVTHPLEEAAHLRKISDEQLCMYEDKPDEESPSIAALISLHPVLMAWHWRTEADTLERGYLRGRAIAAHDVRMGLDDIELNGSVHYDSDTEPPPLWLVRKAERLARGE